MFTFDSNVLELTDAKNNWGEDIPFEASELYFDSDGKGETVVKAREFSKEKLFLKTNVQSQNDAQMGPFDMDLRKLS